MVLHFLVFPWRGVAVSRTAWVATIAGVLMAGCASVPAGNGMDTVARLTQQRTGVDIHAAQRNWPRNADDEAAIRNVVDEALDQPLGADDAVRIALLNNPGLQASYAELGFAAADLIEAGRPRNPGFSFAKLRKGSEREIDRTLVFDVIGLITAPWRVQIASRQFESTQYAVAQRAVRVAGEARKAWVRAVAAEQSVLYFVQAREAAEAGAELGERMAQAGNWPRLTALREKAFLTDALNGFTRAKSAAVAQREHLGRVLGIDDPTRIQLPERLPDLPADLRDTGDAQRVALDERLDVRAAKLRLEATARDFGLTRATRFINVLDLGYQNNTFTENGAGAPKEQGFEVSIEIPLFDFGAARATRAEAVYRQSAAVLAQTVIGAKSEVRERAATTRNAWELARHYRTEVVPLRKAITDEMTLRYNGMLNSVFELLADAREQMNAVAATIEAERDYWLADADLQYALTTGSPSMENTR